MVEPEVAWYDSEMNMQLQEEFVTYIVQRALERCRPQLEYLERDISKLERVVEGPFPRISYTEAIERLQAKGSDIEWGEDLGAQGETAVSEEYDMRLFIYNHPKVPKACSMTDTTEDPR